MLEVLIFFRNLFQGKIFLGRPSGITVNISQLPDAIRSEIAELEQRFQFDSIVEIASDMHSFVIRCILSKYLKGLIGISVKFWGY